MTFEKKTREPKTFFKPEPTDVQGTCVRCETNPQSSKGSGKFRALCWSCHKERYPKTNEYYRNYARERRKNEEFVNREKGERQRVGYKKYKKSYCECCGFIAEETCQLDVDHIDGDNKNNDPSNLKTLCANCHRLKTYRERNFKKKKTYVTMEETI